MAASAFIKVKPPSGLNSLRITPTRSGWFGALWGLIYMGVILVITQLPLPIWSQWVLVGLLSLQTGQEVGTHILRNTPHAITHALWDAQGRWVLQFASGLRCIAELEGDSLVTLALLVLNFRLSSGRRCSLILTTDNCDSESLRQLRVRLHLEHGRLAQDPSDA
jgi:hypothetical protein